jgi:two-component system, OmpR family, phosphate regulon response regulator PhoB
MGREVGEAAGDTTTEVTERGGGMYNSNSGDEVLLLAAPPERQRLEAQLRTRLTAEGVELRSFEDVLTLGSYIVRHPGNVVLLGADVTAIIEVVRQAQTLAVATTLVVLPAGSDESDQLLAFDLGADDVMIAPCSTLEMVARLRALRRRARPTDPGVRVVFGPLEVDLTASEVRVEGQLVRLTAQEFSLLAFLVSNPRHTFTRRELLHGAWKHTAEWNDRATVTEHVGRLRRKLATPAVGAGHWITTVHGIGYRFDPPEPARVGI